MKPETGNTQKPRPPLTIGGTAITPGTRTTIDLPVADLYTHAALTMPVQVLSGRKPGPRMMVSAALHGDELNGVEIIRRLLKLPALKDLRGTLIAVPIVNVHGFLRHSRYLPDRRDLNRCFPGSATGSVAARLAHVLVSEIVDKVAYGIDLHTGAIYRPNLPQVRADLSQPENERLAQAFGCPVIVDASLREGSLREYAGSRKLPMILYEAGEALRFDEFSVRAGVRGITGVLRELKMLPLRGKRRVLADPVIALDSNWVRAPCSGILRVTTRLGKRIAKGDILGVVADPFGEKEVEVLAEHPGIVIGRTNLPLVHAGDAIYHVAGVQGPRAVASQVAAFRIDNLPTQNEVDGDGYEPPIV